MQKLGQEKAHKNAPNAPDINFLLQQNEVRLGNDNFAPMPCNNYLMKFVS